MADFQQFTAPVVIHHALIDAVPKDTNVDLWFNFAVDGTHAGDEKIGGSGLTVKGKLLPLRIFPLPAQAGSLVQIAVTKGCEMVRCEIMAAPVAADPLGITMDDLNALPEPGPELVGHYKKILKQNLLKEGETFVFATKMVFDPDMVVAMMTAAGELQATGAHVAVFPKINGNTYESGLTAWHWALGIGRAVEGKKNKKKTHQVRVVKNSCSTKVRLT